MENEDLIKCKQNIEVDIAQDESVYVCAICHADLITIDELGKHCKVHYSQEKPQSLKNNEDILEVLTNGDFNGSSITHESADFEESSFTEESDAGVKKMFKAI